MFERLVKEFQFPIPNSNSAAAKKARVAALLTDLGSKLSARIFVPFYTMVDPIDDVDDVTIMLSCLVSDDPKRELYLRRLLLAIHPDRQREIAYKRANEIARQVWKLMNFMFIGDQRARFAEDLRRFCKFAVECWESVRPISNKIEPFVGDDEFDDKYWLPAELNLIGQDKKSQSNGKANSSSDKSNGLASKASLHSLNALNQLDCMWPGFYIDGQVLKKGYMLLESQVRGAIEESPYRHRSRRYKQRARAQSGKRQSGSFQAHTYTIASPAPTPTASPAPGSFYLPDTA